MNIGPGALLGKRYELVALLGSGGTSDVYRAEDRVLARSVAVKVLRDSPDTDRDRARFAAEVRVLAALAHPGLVRLLDADADGARPYLVLELVAGHTWGQLLGGGPAAPADVARIGGQVAAALAAAHAGGVMHRDVKPGNILVDASGRARLTDFGIARLVGETVRNTRTGFTVGTAAYLAPEQVRGTELTTAVDVYALGLVMLEALTGARPFPGTSVETALARLEHGPAIPVSLPAGWPALLAAMTAGDPRDRPTSAEVADRLARLADPATPAAFPDHPTEDLAPRARRRTGLPVSLVAAALALLVGAAGVVGITRGTEEPAVAGDRAAQASPSAPPAEVGSPITSGPTSTGVPTPQAAVHTALAHQPRRPAPRQVDEPRAKTKADAKGKAKAKAKGKVKAKKKAKGQARSGPKAGGKSRGQAKGAKRGGGRR